MKARILWTAVLTLSTVPALHAQGVYYSPVFHMPLQPAPSPMNGGYYWVLPDGRCSGPNYYLVPPFTPLTGFNSTAKGQELFANLFGQALTGGKHPNHQNQNPNQGGYQGQPRNVGVGSYIQDFSEPGSINPVLPPIVNPQAAPGKNQARPTSYSAYGYPQTSVSLYQSQGYYPPMQPYPYYLPSFNPYQPVSYNPSQQQGYYPGATQYYAPNNAGGIIPVQGQIPPVPNPPALPPVPQPPAAARAYGQVPIQLPGLPVPPNPFAIPNMNPQLPCMPGAPTMPGMTHQLPGLPTPSYAPRMPNQYPALPSPTYSPQFPPLPSPGYACPQNDNCGAGGNPGYYHPEGIRSPRDFFMWGDVQQDKLLREARALQVP